MRPTNFGPSLWRQSNLQKLVSIAQVLPTAADLLSLAAYIRRHGIEILHSTDRPRDAKWLTADERQALLEAIGNERRTRAQHDLMAALTRDDDDVPIVVVLRLVKPRGR